MDRDRVGRRLSRSGRQRRQGLGAAAGVGRVGTAMIPVPSGVRVWLAVGRTDMRRGMNGLALQVQQVLGRDPHAGDLYVFRGADAIWSRSSGTTASACRFTRNGSTAASSSGPRQPMGSFPSPRPSWPICSTESTGEIRREPGGRPRPAELRQSKSGGPERPKIGGSPGEVG